MAYELRLDKETIQGYADMKSSGELQKAAETCMCFWMISDALDKTMINNVEWDGITERRNGDRRITG